jgi:uncharacterized protein involved in exopolysaccharide biosynthesis
MRPERGAFTDAAHTSLAGEGELDLSALARALWRKRRWIVVPTLAAALVSFVAVNVVTPRYKSETRVLVENRETAYNRPEGERTPERDRTLVDAEAVQSQVQLAQSRDLARKVVRDLKLAEKSEFNPLAAGSLIGNLLWLAGLGRDPSQMTVEERVLERYYERLTVYPIERSRVIAIEFQSEEPELAAKIANTIAENYLVVQQQAKQEAMRQASQWLAGEIERLRGKVAEAEARVEEFRARANLYLGPNNASLNAQGLGELNSQLTLARTQKSDFESKSRMIREILRSGRPIEASEIVNSELIRRLNEQRVTLRAQLAEQSSTLLPQHPRIKELRAQIADLEAQIRAEAEKLSRSLENDAKIAGARVESLLASLDQLKRQSSAAGTQDVELRALEREAKAQRDLLESYLSRYRDVSARETPDAVQPDARVISRAVASSTPYFPKKIPIILIATAAVLLFAVGFVVTGELLGNDVYGRTLPSESRIEQARAAVAAALESPPEPVPPTVPKSSRAMLGDRVRNLGRGIVLVAPVSTSAASPRVAVELARELSEGKARVILLDLDAETAPSAMLVRDSRTAGATELLAGLASFNDVIRRDPASRLHVIALGDAQAPGEFLAAPRLSILLGALAQTYDHVVVATPALGGLEGSERLAGFVRATVLYAEGGEEPSAEVETLAARGFANVLFYAAGPEAGPDLAAA